VAEKKSKMAAPPVEDLGSYNTFNKQATFKKDRVIYWVGVGAQPTITVHNLLVKGGVLKAKKLPVKMKKAVEKSAVEVAPVATEEAPVAAAEEEAVDSQ